MAFCILWKMKLCVKMTGCKCVGCVFGSVFFLLTTLSQHLSLIRHMSFFKYSSFRES